MRRRQTTTTDSGARIRDPIAIAVHCRRKIKALKKDMAMYEEALGIACREAIADRKLGQLQIHTGLSRATLYRLAKTAKR